MLDIRCPERPPWARRGAVDRGGARCIRPLGQLARAMRAPNVAGAGPWLPAAERPTVSAFDFQANRSYRDSGGRVCVARRVREQLQYEMAHMRGTEATRRMQPWPERYVSQRAPSQGNIDTFAVTLRTASDEKPIQTLLETTPSLLRCLTVNTRDFWCFPRPSFGGELVPDFILANRVSYGYEWVLVELESPTQRPLIGTGLPSRSLRKAMGQVRDWRIWLRENIAYAQVHLGFLGITADCPAWIAIGRRTMIQPKHALKYRELSTGALTVMTYDRFADMMGPS